MTVAFFSGSRRRAAVALGAVSAGLLVLSACDKPTPIATVTVGSESIHSEAACYNDGDALKESQIQQCLNKKAEKSITVNMTDKIRFGVDPEIADTGWTIFLGGQQAEPEPFKKTYRTIPASAFFSSQTGEATDSTTVTIVQNTDKKLTGIWHFELKKES
ncbi:MULTISPECIES: DUF2771 domain-containing protein [unclassified Streptomyces]|uniref:DUF2771 domain-containing protein n=1 Tax=unclassified Streptomyces TaxID=2593676 RepID=UPI0016600FEB|nr:MULTISPECIES: DUF2771 domain-containing protein [unclassified Streptomyces]MBD0707306.1 DUF2771 domain-containing protein [Streptomyces sp. CBMA291]MBD0713794.1 DUF2771 domain-containing protein [Streptomyces sp. CBMA370]